MTEFIRICSTEDVPKGTAVRAVTGDLEIAVVHAEDEARGLVVHGIFKEVNRKFDVPALEEYLW